MERVKSQKPNQIDGYDSYLKFLILSNCSNY
jgi:hypothetical protein